MDGALKEQRRDTKSVFFNAFSAQRRIPQQLVNCDYQSVNSLCSRYHYVNSVFLSSLSINLLAFYHECRSLIGYVTHYLFYDR